MGDGAHSRPDGRGQMKVMIVDDEKPIRQWFESILMSIPGTKVTGTFPNGKAALEGCREEVPDLIFTDILMPVMNGIELIRAVKQEYPQVEILILSNYNDFDYVHQGLKLGAKDYLLKAQTGDEEIREFVEKIEEERSQKSYQDQEKQMGIQECLKKLEEYSSEVAGMDTEEYRCVKQRLMQILEKYRNEPVGETSDYLINQIVEYIHLNYSKPVKLLSLAEELNYNADYLSQTFKQKTGKNFNAYLTEIRMEKAKELLADPGRKIKDVAAKAGYQNEMYFSTAFKNYTGMSPKRYITYIKTSK